MENVFDEQGRESESDDQYLHSPKEERGILAFSGGFDHYSDHFDHAFYSTLLFQSSH